MLATVPTFFFRELYPFLLLTSYIVLNKNNIRYSNILIPFLIIISALYLIINSDFLESYYIIFFYFYDEILLVAALLSGLIGGLATIDPIDITNFIYSPTVFVLNF